MKHIFIINPVAGSGKGERIILPKIIETVKKEGVDYVIHRTINVGDGENFVKKQCLSFPNETLRFYAVGGDGTLNEVVNGAYGFTNAEIAFIPAGTGNDFVRIFPDKKSFSCIKSQLYGTSRPIDLIEYDDKKIINMLNIGLDCAVVSEMNVLKKKLPLKGALAYIGGVGVVFTYNKGYNLKITLDDGRVYDEEFTLVAIGNGAYCGGGFKGVPKALIDDGLLDVSLIRKVTRRRFAALIGKYRKGTHLESPLAKDIIEYVQCKSLVIEPVSNMEICVDGEIYNSGTLKISIMPRAINFSIPAASLGD